MRRKHLVYLFIVAQLAVTDTGCTKQAQGIPGPTGPAGQPGATGAGVKPSPVTGYMDLFDQYSNPYPSSAGVTLSVQSGDSLLTTTTDSTGQFSLGPLPPGTYDIKVTKPGFDSLEIYVQHSGGNEAKFIGGTKMYQTLSTLITGQTVTFLPNGSGGSNPVLTISFTGPPMTMTAIRGFYFYFSHSSNVTSQHYDYSFGQSYASGTNQFQLQSFAIDLSSFARPPFNPGDSVYIKTIIGHTFDTQSFYYDYLSDRSITYPYRGDSAVTSFVMQ